MLSFPLTPSSSMLADAVGRYAASAAGPRVRAVEARLRGRRSIAVVGRPGVGRKAVAAALGGAGLRVVTTGADVCVLVVAEAFKPEDAQTLATRRPALIVLNKADLCGRVAGGPLADAGRLAGQIAAAARCPVVPMVAHLATTDVDAEMVAALRTLAATPADMTSADAFVTSPHVLPAPVRRHLLERLDRFGIAHAALAVVEGAGAEGSGVEALAAHLRSLSQVDAVTERLKQYDAEIGYRRACSALSELRRIAAETRDDDLAAFLVSNEVVLAVMASAADVMEAAGGRVGSCDELRTAVRWRRCADGPFDELHRRAAADISRGTLRRMR